MKFAPLFKALSSSLAVAACLAVMAPDAPAQGELSKSDFGGNGRVTKRRPTDRPALGGDEGGTKPTGAPEIEPSLAAGGFLLLIGGSLILVGRRRRATV